MVMIVANSEMSSIWPLFAVSLFCAGETNGRSIKSSSFKSFFLIIYKEYFRVKKNAIIIINSQISKMYYCRSFLMSDLSKPMGFTLFNND